jgi:D-alanyl-D-alanine carboxypeptidase/D-alanyl-D-alanine-endopeptidase (penicillin-binding protein 4)
MAGRWTIMVCATLTVGVSTAHADREHGPAGSSREATRHAHSISAPSLRGRSAIPGLEREAPSVESDLIDELRRLESQRPLRRGTTAIYVVDATTGRTIYAVHEDEPLNPASNVKLISTATALDVLGPDWRYTTRVLGPAPGPDGTVTGDLYFIGSYDPTLRPAHLGELAAALASAGIERVHGDIVVGHEGLRDSLGPARIDVHVQAGEVGMAPAVQIVADAGLLSDEAIRADYLTQSFELDVQAQTKRRRRGRLDVQVSQAETTPPRYRIEITGVIGKERRVHVQRRLPQPQIHTAQLLRAALAQAGIQVQGSVRRSELSEYVAEATMTAAGAGGLPIELARHESAPLATLVARINKSSLNGLADRVVMTAGAVLYGGPPTMDKGVRAMQGWLREHAGLDPDRMVIDTGSGLSYNTALTARQIVRVLRAAGGLWTPDRPASTPDLDANAAPAAEPGLALIAMLDQPAPERTASTASPALANVAVEVEPAVDSEVEPAVDSEVEPAVDSEVEPELASDVAPESGDIASEITEFASPSGQALTVPAAGQTGAPSLAEAFLHSLAVGGVDGTLRYRFRELRGQVLGKTGTLRKVVALSGLVSHGNDKLAFAIVTNGTDWRQRQRVRRQHEQIVAALHRYLRNRAGGVP